MKNVKSIFAATALTVALVSPMAAWAWDDDEDDDRKAVVTFETFHQEGVQWGFVLDHDQCAAIPGRFGAIEHDGDLGDRVAQVTTKRRANGSKRIDILDVVTGTEEDSHGGTYIWVYENHAIYNVPPGEDTVRIKVDMQDSFRVIGNGFEMEIGFHWRWKFLFSDGVFNPRPEFNFGNGLVFPDDAVSPSNVIDFRALSTQGDVIACDPI